MKSKFPGWIRNLPYLAVAGGLLIAVTFAGCGSDDDGNGSSSDAGGVTSALQPITGSLADLPVVGELLGTCTEEVLLVVDGVVGGIPASEGLEAIPVLGDLTQGLEGIPVLGGILAGEGGLSSLPIDTVTGLLSVPLSALEGLPVLGTLPLSCENLPLIDGEPLSSLFGIVPIFDLTGEPIGVVLAIVQDLPLVGEIPGLGGLVEVILSSPLDLGELAGTGLTDFGVLEPILSLLEGLPILSGLLAALPLPV